MSDLISRLSEIRSQYNCLNESEEPYYRALSEVIKMLSEQADGDTISRQAAIDIVVFECGKWTGLAKEISKQLKQLPPAQPEIIRCNSCKHWTQSTGKMKGYGLGRCDFHDADLVACNGFCYWAERREDGSN